jgi:hypothetical protein
MFNDLLADIGRNVCGRDWDAAAKICDDALSLGPLESTWERGRITDLLGKCQFRRAFESSTRQKFEEEMQLAVGSYKSASQLYREAGSSAFEKRVVARAIWGEFWIERDSDKRRELVSRCIELAEGAALEFETTRDQTYAAETHLDILSYRRSAIDLANEFSELKIQFEKALQVGRKAIAELDELSKPDDLLEALYTTIWVAGVKSHMVVEPSEIPKFTSEAEFLAGKLGEVSTKLGTPYAQVVNYHVAGDIAWDVKGDAAKGLKLYEEGVAISRLAKDRLVLGRLLWVLISATDWQGVSEQYSENRKEILQKGLAFASEAIRFLEVPYDTTYLAVAHAFAAYLYIDLARFAESIPEAKRNWLRRAVDIASKGAKFETGTWASDKVLHALSKATYLLATITVDVEEKSRLLREALQMREDELKIADVLGPNGWDRGVGRNYRGLIRAELAKIEPDIENRAGLMRAAVQDMGEAVAICRQRTDPDHMKIIARYGEEFGDALFQLFKLTKEDRVAKSVTNVYNDSVSLLTAAGQVGPLGSLFWKIGKANEVQGDYEGAAKAFARAAENFRLSATKNPAPAESLMDFARYMDAWALIEKARVHHDKERYLAACEDYAKASYILQSTKLWAHLSKHYAACSLLERGEGESLQERQEESAESFGRASELFQDAKLRLETKMHNCKEPVEKNELLECLAKAKLEEARLLDKQGSNTASLSRYRAAAEAFRDLIAEGNADEVQGGLETTALFCEGFAEMKQAEVSSSPQLYATAAKLFLQAEKKATEEKYRALAKANSSICKALVSFTRFQRRSSTRLYSKTKSQLETATELYEKAGFEKIAGWTRATQRLFEGLAQIAAAEEEKSPRKKTEIYRIAEKYLASASRLYAKVGFHGREVEVRKLLRRASEEKELSLLTETKLGNPAALQGLMPASLLKDQPLGLERVEAARIVGKMNLTDKVVSPGSSTAVELEFTNMGRSSATLVKLEGIVQEGLEITEGPAFSIRDGFLDMNGKRLDHLKSHSLTIPIRAEREGIFELRPRITVVDDSGNKGIEEFESAALIAHGRTLPEDFQPQAKKHLESEMPAVQSSWFETQRGKEVFQHLARGFLQDYVSKGLFVEKAGWRSLMDLVRDLEIPRSAFYRKGGGDGAVLVELERRGLVELRTFSEERGRGGAITKLRVAHDNPSVRIYLKQALAETL